MKNSIFVALWGNPLKWEYATYDLKDFSDRAVTSSGVIHDHICPEAESFIFLPDSLFPELYVNNDVIDAHKDIIIDNIKKEIMAKNDVKSVEFISNSHIILFPSIGSFFADGVSFTLEVNVNFLYTYFYRKSLDYMETQEKLDEIIIDMTHGINFLQFIFLESLKYAGMVYSLRHRRDIVIEYYNSSPYSGGAPISIILVRIVNILFKNVLSSVSRDFLNVYKKNKNQIINYYKNLGLNVNPLYIKGCAIMILSVTLPYLAYVLSQIDVLKVPAYGEITLAISKDEDMSIITHEFPGYYMTYMENMAFFDVLMAVKEFLGYNNGIYISELYTALDLYFGGESGKIFVKSELVRMKSNHNGEPEFSEANFSRNFKAHAGLLNGLYDLNNNTISFKVYNHHGNKINIEWVITKLVNE